MGNSINKLLLNKKTSVILLAVWIIIWQGVFLKNLFIKGYIRNYAELIKAGTLEEKHAVVSGKSLYDLFSAFKTSVPTGATFGYDGIAAMSIEDRRAMYYLYPNLKSDDPQYLIVFNGDIEPDGQNWKMFIKLDNNRYVLKRIK